MDLETMMRELMDRQQIADTLYRYASTIDDKDFAGLRATLTDDAVGQYGVDAEPIRGGDEIVAWIDSAIADQSWQHHKLTVYHIDIDGEEARTLTYHTSHQIKTETPDRVTVIVARYRDVLRRESGTWKIADKLMEIGLIDERPLPTIAV